MLSAFQMREMPQLTLLNLFNAGKMLHSALPLHLHLMCCCTLALLLLHYCTCISQEGAILLNIKMRDWRYTRHVLRGWNDSHENPCGWNGISCNQANAVIKVNLTGGSVSGNLTCAICRLPSLESLILQSNAFHGHFPHCLLECKRLRVLDLSSNQLAGTLPSRIHELSELRFLNLAKNSFSGSIPPTFGMLPKLQVLFFHNNCLKGTIPAFLGNLTALKNFTINNNPLHPGVIPTELGKLKRLQQLWLYNCSLVAQIPAVLSNLTQLEDLQIWSNHLSGDIPSCLMGLSNLKTLYLYANNLSGNIPSNIDELRSISDLDLSDNQLSGEIPERIANLTYLSFLHLFRNQLTGGVPEQLGKLRYLSGLKLYNNKLSGLLPQSLGSYSDVTEVDVSGNKFEGPLPKDICKGRTLYSLDIFSNNFNGTLPSSLEGCSSLHFLMISDNQLSGEIPAGIWAASNLVWLRVNNNKFEGQIPAAIDQTKNLIQLNISSNRFEGRIPAQVGQLTKLEIFSASYNLLSGSIPDELAGLSSITILQLHHNFLSGEIPKDILSLKKLMVLNLGDNRLEGEIPAISQTGMPSLDKLDLSNNLLFGRIPPELGSLGCTIFNVSGNRLSGPVPYALDQVLCKESLKDNPELCGNRKLILPACSSKKPSSRSWAAIVVTPLVVAVLALCSICLCCSSLRKIPSSVPLRKVKSFHSPGLDESDSDHILRNLKNSNLIGCGSSGKVYKVTLSDGRIVAVKKIQNIVPSTGFKRKAQREKDDLVEVEVETLGLIRHSNILKLLCYIWSEESDFKLLVYEYMPNGSLSEQLHHDQVRDGREMVLQWRTRCKIALGAARGLSYMHHDCRAPILHRDVKSSNILLDADFEAKIADFGLSRELNRLGDEYAVSGYVGSHGYIAPEYVNRLRVCEKSDVYSFGVVLLEMVCGLKATGEAVYGEGVGISQWIRNIIQMEEMAELAALDWRILRDKNCIEQMMNVLRVGVICTNEVPNGRPSMQQVVEMLVRCGCSEKREERRRRRG